MRTALILLSISVSLSAGTLGAGIVAGVSATGLPMSSGNTCAWCAYSTRGGRFVAGPVIELRLPSGLGIEADALYRSVANPSGSVWEFPLLAKLRVPVGGRVRPVVAGGLSFQRNGALYPNQYGPNETISGAAVGAGLEAKGGPLRLTPTIRFTHWTGNYDSRGANLVNRNQVEVMIGLTF